MFRAVERREGILPFHVSEERFFPHVRLGGFRLADTSSIPPFVLVLEGRAALKLLHTPVCSSSREHLPCTHASERDQCQ